MKLSSDQEELRSLVRRVFEERVTSEYRRARIANGVRSDAALDTALTELGLLEAFEGQEPLFSSVELGVIAYESGRVLLPAAICERLAAAFLGPSALSEADRVLLDSALSGELQVALAPAACCSLTIEKGRASGEIAWASGADDARFVIGTGTVGEETVAVVIPLSEPGVRVTPCSSLDLTAALSTFTLRDVPVAVLSEDGEKRLQAALELVRAEEAAGICSKVLEMSVEYVKTREQFGVPIGGFQAVQHKLADAFAQSEALRALAQFAAWSYTHDPSQRILTARAAAAYAASVAPKVCESALQCHGGIGFTWEYDLHLYLRRAKVIESAFGLDESRSAGLLRAARA